MSGTPSSQRFAITVNDPEINRGVRRVLARNWYDLSKTNFASRRGILRLMGELKKVGRDQDGKLDCAHLESLDTELRRLKGVQRIHFDLDNWRRTDDGEWVSTDQARPDAKADRGGGGDLSDSRGPTPGS